MHRSMDNLEQLSDADLRLRLIQFGFPNLPVTDTTRKILIKKLRNHMNNEKAKLRRETKYATRYSSDEESDLEAKKQKGRNTIATTTTTSSSNVRTTTNKYNSNNHMPPPSSTIVSRRITTSPQQINHLSRDPISKFSVLSSSNDFQTKDRPNINSVYVPPPILALDKDEDSDYINYKPHNPIHSRLSTSPLTSSTTYNNYTPDNSHNDSWIRNRYSTGTTATTSSPNYKSNINVETQPITNGHHGNTDNTRYSSDFTRRLLNLRGETIRNSVYNNTTNKLPTISRYSRMVGGNNLSTLRSAADPAEIVHQQSESRTQKNISPSTAFSNLINRLDEQYGVKQTLIPCVLLTALVVFFILVGFMYMTMSPDLANTISERNTFYRICEPESLRSAIATSGYTCIEQDSLEDALNLLKIMAPELQKRVEHNMCKDNTVTFAMSAKEIIQLVQERENRNVIRTIRDIHNVEYLIDKNPQWKINNIDSIGNLLSFDEVVQLRKTQSNYFAILNPRLPFTCSLLNKLQKFFFLVGGLGLILLSIGTIYFIYKLFIRYQQSKRDAVTNLIEEIISNLKRKTSCDPDQNLVVVMHLRDKLIPLHKRKKLEWAWNAAIQYLEQNESRIQFELGIRNGEDCKLMKWVDTVSPEQIGHNNSGMKKWQSPAFDKTTKIANPPTPCLKIRQMFDKYEIDNPNLKIILQDAILEKVGPTCKIYDMQLDKINGAVYMRCATAKDAGMVHDEVNGWWFDNRLVSMKFLRLERYLARFPRSSSGPMCLYPSNTNNYSMTHCSKNIGSMNGLEDDDDDDDDMDIDN